jgi:undecaprenyl-diphosphatase
MNTLEAIALGALQGVTEFLPVSSSGHLVIAQELLGEQEPGVLLEVSLHFGTLLAILFVFRKDLCRVVHHGLAGALMRLRGASRDDVTDGYPHYRAAWAVAIGSIPAALAGIFLKSTVERVMDSAAVAGVCLMVTGFFLLLLRKAPEGREEPVNPGRGLLVGVAQAFALLPGISRSGSTIVAGRFLKMGPETAARFSFLLAVPAVAGATLLEAASFLRGGAETATPGFALAAGTVTSIIVGVLSLVWLLRLLRGGKLHWFAFYCLPLGAATLIWTLLGGSA